MSEEEKNIDQLFSDAAQNQRAPKYKPEYWNEMNTFLNARAARRRKLILWSSAGAIVALFLLTSLFIINTNEENPRVQYTQNQLTLDRDKTPSFKEGAATNRASLNEHDNSLASKSQEQSSLASKQSELNQQATQGDKLTQKNTINNKESNTSSSKNIVSNKDEKQNTLNDQTMEHYSSASKDKIERENIASKKQSKTAKKKNQVEDHTSNNRQSESGDDFKYNLPVLKVQNLSQKSPGSLVDPKVKRKSKLQLSLYAKLSGGLMENYKTARPYESGVVDLSFNIEAKFNSILFRTGVGTQYTTHADLIVSQKTKIYGFGARNQQNDLSYQSLLDIYIPIEFGYQVNSTSFGIGVQGNYLLTTGMELNTYTDQVLTNSKTYYGNKDGLRSLSAQGYVWVEQRLFNRFSMGLKIGTHMSRRIKDTKYFNRSATINPIYGQLSFRLNIL